MLEMKNVTKTFGNFKALDDLTLTVPSGRVYGLVGPNGAGKSTAIRHLTGVYRPDSGSVTLGGQPKTVSSPCNKTPRGGGPHRLHPRRDFLLPLRDAGGYAQVLPGHLPHL